MEIEVKPQFMTVTELNRLVREEIENNPYLTNIWVKGEIFNLTYHSSGHIYFTLKDEGAAVSAVFFRNYNKNMKFRLEEGMSVLVLGGLTVFEKRGSYQLNAMSVRPEGAGFVRERWTREPDIVALYFGAGWCGPCHAFVPVLRRTRDALREAAGRCAISSGGSAKSKSARVSGMEPAL